MRVKLTTKRGVSRLQLARKYRSTAKYALDLFKVTFVYINLNNISHDLTIFQTVSNRAADDILEQRLVDPISWDMVNRVSFNQRHGPLECVLSIFSTQLLSYSSLALFSPILFLSSPTDLREAERASSPLGSDRCSIVNILPVAPTMKREDELVSLFIPGFALPLLLTLNLTWSSNHWHSTASVHNNSTQVHLTVLTQMTWKST